MDNLPTKSESSTPTEVDVLPTWRELGERFRDPAVVAAAGTGGCGP